MGRHAHPPRRERDVNRLVASSKLNAEWEFSPCCMMRGEGPLKSFWRRTQWISGAAPPWISTSCCKVSDAWDFLGILVALGLLIWLAYRGWSVLLLAPAAALLAAAFAGEPLLANWTQTFMGSAASFSAQFFPLFLLGALFGKLMEDSGAVVFGTALGSF